jgi:hypothetical protein
MPRSAYQHWYLPVALVGSNATFDAQLIAGAQWDQDGRMPRGWQPFSSLRWLADWLRRNNPNASAEPLHDVAVLGSKPFHALSRKEKAALLFLHYNKQHARYARGNPRQQWLARRRCFICARAAASCTAPRNDISLAPCMMWCHPIQMSTC